MKSKLKKTQKRSDTQPAQAAEPRVYVGHNNINTTVKVFDGDSLEAVLNVSRALLNMTELFKSQNINITGIKITDVATFVEKKTA